MEGGTHITQAFYVFIIIDMDGNQNNVKKPYMFCFCISMFPFVSEIGPSSGSKEGISALNCLLVI